VIRRSSLEYERAIASDFTATAQFVDEAQRVAFIPTLLETGKARIEVQTVLAADAKMGVRFKGEFVALLAA
jgi:thioesterase domain-containing protein